MNLRDLISLKQVLVILFVILMAGVSFLFQDNVQYFILVGALGALFYREQLKVDLIVYQILIYWLVINIISVRIINNDQSYSAVTIFSRMLKLLAIYFIVKLGGDDFFRKLNRHIYILTIIGIVAYGIQMAAPSFIRSLSEVFKPITRPGFSEEGNWYAYFYTYSAWHPFRNCGFMWEPGAFAGFLIFMITYRLSVNGYSVDKYIVVYLVGAVTSLSTAGYLALGILAVAFFIKNYSKNIWLVILIPVVIVFIVRFYKNNEFMSKKIEAYIVQGTNTWGGVSEDGSYRTTRLGYALIVLDESVHWPFGHGVIIFSSFEKEKYGMVIGPGAMSDILHQWGWPGIFLVVGCIYRFYRRELNIVDSLMFTMALIVVLFSNPGEFLNIVYAIIFYVICFKTKTIEIDV